MLKLRGEDRIECLRLRELAYTSKSPEAMQLLTEFRQRICEKYGFDPQTAVLDAATAALFTHDERKQGMIKKHRDDAGYRV